jgi:DNA recombination protein RmuC
MSVPLFFSTFVIAAVLAIFGLVAVILRGREARERTALEVGMAELRAALARKSEEAQRLESERNDLRSGNGVLLERATAAETQTAERQLQLEGVLSERQDLSAKYADLQGESAALRSELAAVSRDLVHEREQSAEKLSLLENAREQLTNQFKTLANEILEEKSKRFVEQNQTNLGQLLDPLKTRLCDFQAKVEEVQKENIAGRSELKTHLENLQKLNQQLSQDAANLVTALRGSSKTQGDWGEFILEQLLESSGLRKDVEYLVQESFVLDENKRARPDVIVRLPGGKHLVIDSKVSLLAYTDYCNCEDKVEQAAFLAQHLSSVRTHLNGLAKKNYQTLYELNSLDFVVLFIPVEPAFMLAIAQDSRLWQDAYDKNVLLVSPTTLLFVIRTVASLWRQERQQNSVKQIVDRGSELYDRLVGFVAELEKVGERLKQANSSYDDAFRKLTTGRGNVIRQAELLRNLGVKPSKNLPAGLVDSALEDPEELAPEVDPEVEEDASSFRR